MSNQAHILYGQGFFLEDNYRNVKHECSCYVHSEVATETKKQNHIHHSMEHIHSYVGDMYSSHIQSWIYRPTYINELCARLDA